MKKYIINFFNRFYLYKYLAYQKHKYDVIINPKKEANRVYRPFFKKDINWDYPKNLIEKIYWLQLNSDTSLWTKCADKYLVRDYFRKFGYDKYLPILFGKWENANDIDFNKLPNSFVIKINNGCGRNLIVRDKSSLNKKLTMKKLNRWMSIPYGYSAAQLHYTRIKPCIIAEQLLGNSVEKNEPLIDYKIWCFHGVPEAIMVVFDRNRDSYFVSLYDLGWNNISVNNLELNSTHFSGKDIPRPKSLEKMLEISGILSKGIPQVRIDFYDINGKPYIGEMTFTTGFGYFSKNYYDYLGSKIDLTKYTNEGNNQHI